MARVEPEATPEVKRRKHALAASRRARHRMDRLGQALGKGMREEAEALVRQRELFAVGRLPMAAVRELAGWRKQGGDEGYEWKAAGTRLIGEAIGKLVPSVSTRDEVAEQQLRTLLAEIAELR
ncbi:hypothetical protein LTR65_007892 [Meristemomyces frigidus]